MHHTSIICSTSTPVLYPRWGVHPKPQVTKQWQGPSAVLLICWLPTDSMEPRDILPPLTISLAPSLDYRGTKEGLQWITIYKSAPRLTVYSSNAVHESFHTWCTSIILCKRYLEQITVPQSSGDLWTNAVAVTSLRRTSWLKPLSHGKEESPIPFKIFFLLDKSSVMVTSFTISNSRWCSVSSTWARWNRSLSLIHL